MGRRERDFAQIQELEEESPMKSLTRTALATVVASVLVLSGGAALALQGPTNKPTDVESVLAFERAFADAVIAGDVYAFDAMTTDDFQMTHGDQWTNGGTPSAVDSKEV